MNLVIRALVAGAFCAVAGSASASTLYSQPSDGLYVPYASQNDTHLGGSGHFATVYDNFALTADATITNVAFSGAYFNPAEPSIISAFTVNFYGDGAGVPGALLQSTTIVGNGSETSAPCTDGGGPCEKYSVGVNFAALGGTTYWLSIVPDMDFPPQWGWTGGTGGDDASRQVFFGTASNLPTDRAFTLSDGGVPEPASWALMILGLGGVGASMRSRRRSAAATA